MEVIRDCKGRVVCMGDAAMGLIEMKYGPVKVTTPVEIGHTVQIRREQVTTRITRIDTRAFYIESSELPPVA